MILGLIAGGWLRITEPGGKKVLRFIVAGAISLAIGVILDLTGICPSVKRIWTPSWVLVSGGICMLFLAAFYFIIDFKGFSAWSFPFRVIGANSIVAYFLADAWGVSQYPHRMLETHLGKETFDYFGPDFHAVFIGFVILAIWWLILYWLYRKKIFVKI
jgi:predicted acyltransferase